MDTKVGGCRGICRVEAEKAAKGVSEKERNLIVTGL